MASETLLDVAGLRVSFPGEAGRIDAVRGVDYDVRAGEVVAIVGESGSGKSVSSLAVLGLLPDQARVTGSIRFQGRELLGLGDRELSRLRGAAMSMVFQDPLSALTPVYRVGDQIAEALLVHGAAPDRTSARARAVELLELVGIDDAATRATAFPHEFSGGMRQRVVIAMAIANDPALICVTSQRRPSMSPCRRRFSTCSAKPVISPAPASSSSPTTWGSPPRSPTGSW